MEDETVIALNAVVDVLDKHVATERKDEFQRYVGVLADLVHNHINSNEKYSDDHLPQAMKMDLRMKSIELGIALATAKGKPSHAVYIAADMYRFIITGERPPQVSAREKPEKETA